jgi:uncharacterized protein (TIGR03435 family)
MTNHRFLSAALVIVAPIVVTAGALRTPHLHAQTPGAAPDALAFEVASIKPNKSGDGRVMIGGAPGSDRYTATNVTVRQLLQISYQIQPFQIEGGPKWLDTDHFDIVAKAPAQLQALLGRGQAPGTGPGPMQLMMRSLLAERFKLVMHNETREASIYALVKARADGKLGPRMNPSTTDCAALARGRGPGPPPPGPPQPGERPPCGMFGGLGRFAAGAVTMPQFAQFLSQRVNRVIVDRTGLTGGFDLDLDFTPEQLPTGQLPPGVQLPPADGPSIYTALQEQLGLKLDSQKGPVDVLVIDRIEQPTDD